MNFVLRTAHAEEKKKGVTQTPTFVPYIIIYILKSQMYHPCGARFARPIIVLTGILVCHILYRNGASNRMICTSNMA